MTFQEAGDILYTFFQTLLKGMKQTLELSTINMNHYVTSCRLLNTYHMAGTILGILLSY